MIRKLLLLAFIVTASVSSFANVKLAAVFSDHMVLQRDKSIPIWGSASPGEKVSITLLNETKTATAASDGKWTIALSKRPAGGPFQVSIKGNNALTINDIYIGDVWICSGQSNMDFTVAKEDRYWCGVYNEAEEVANANYPKIRMFDTDFKPSKEPKEDVVGKWEVVSPSTIGHLSAVAYFFARDIQKQIKVPIGLITTAYGASAAEAWISKDALEANPKLHGLLTSFSEKLKPFEADSAAIMSKYRQDQAKWKADAEKAKAEGKTAPRGPKNPNPVVDQHNPYVLWNGMVSPLVPYGIKGALWYQGESNSPSASIYRDIMETLILDWRKKFNQGDFPFFYVQLANRGKLYDTIPGMGGAEAVKRQAQLENLSIQNTAMAVAIDNANPEDMEDVHPKNKQEIGRRLALAARAKVYGENIPYSGPIYKSMKIKGNEVSLTFDHADGGLVLKNGGKGFAIAGADKKFVWADARVAGNTIVVSSAAVSAPAFIRYGYGNNPPISLYNKADLPASPFVTYKID